MLTPADFRGGAVEETVSYIGDAGKSNNRIKSVKAIRSIFIKYYS